MPDQRAQLAAARARARSFDATKLGSAVSLSSIPSNIASRKKYNSPDELRDDSFISDSSVIGDGGDGPMPIEAATPQEKNDPRTNFQGGGPTKTPEEMAIELGKEKGALRQKAILQIAGALQSTALTLSQIQALEPIEISEDLELSKKALATAIAQQIRRYQAFINDTILKIEEDVKNLKEESIKRGEPTPPQRTLSRIPYVGPCFAVFFFISNNTRFLLYVKRTIALQIERIKEIRRAINALQAIFKSVDALGLRDSLRRMNIVEKFQVKLPNFGTAFIKELSANYFKKAAFWAILNSSTSMAILVISSVIALGFVVGFLRGIPCQSTFVEILTRAFGSSYCN